MADLPAKEVKPDNLPFSYVGVDCFRPFVVKRGRGQLKRFFSSNSIYFRIYTHTTYSTSMYT